jgi:hypothetical protein
MLNSPSWRNSGRNGKLKLSVSRGERMSRTLTMKSVLLSTIMRKHHCPTLSYPLCRRSFQTSPELVKHTVQHAPTAKSNRKSADDPYCQGPEMEPEAGVSVIHRLFCNMVFCNLHVYMGHCCILHVWVYSLWFFAWLLERLVVVLRRQAALNRL